MERGHWEGGILEGKGEDGESRCLREGDTGEERVGCWKEEWDTGGVEKMLTRRGYWRGRKGELLEEERGDAREKEGGAAGRGRCWKKGQGSHSCRVHEGFAVWMRAELCLHGWGPCKSFHSIC